jgi:hypothetical protein
LVVAARSWVGRGEEFLPDFTVVEFTVEEFTVVEFTVGQW